MKQDEAAIAEKAVEVLLGRIAGGRGEEERLVKAKVVAKKDFRES